MSPTRSRLVIAAIVASALAFHANVDCAAQNSGADSSEAGFRIAGTAVNSLNGNPLALARIILRDVKHPQDAQSLLTGDDGRFEFRAPAGKYSLHGAKRGFISSDYDQHEQFSSAVVTGAGLDTEKLVLKMAPSAVLSGKVLDESGEPVRGAAVTLWHEDHATGVSRIARFRNDTTDDQGFYEFTPLDSGTYFLSVSADPWYAVHPPSAPPEAGQSTHSFVDRGLDVAYPTTYYAGATESDDATPIPIRGGDRLELDFHLTPVPTLHIFFRVEDKGENGFPMPVLQKRSFDGIEMQHGGQGLQSVSPGVFEMTTPPGKYAVRFFGPRQIGRISDVDFTQDHQEIDYSSGEALSTISASIKMLGEQSLPKELYVGLRDAHRRNVGFQRVDSQGQAQLTDIAPGSYEVVTGSPGASYSVVRIASADRQTSGHSLTIAPGSSLSLTLTLAGGNARVEGYAKQNGKSFAGAMVVLVPRQPQNNGDLFRRDQSDLDGSFSIQNVIPGTYTVVAIANGWDLDWSQPKVISKYLRSGQTVVVPDHSEHSIQVPEPVSVQAK